MIRKNEHNSFLGHHVDLLTGYPFKSELYTERCDDIPLLRGDNVIQGRIRWEGLKRWPISKLKNLDRYLLKEGDLVIAMDRTWVNAGLKISVISKQDVPSLLVQRVARLRAKDGLEQSYLSLLIRSHQFEQYVKGVQTETAVPHISAKQIKEFRIFLPKIEDQKRLARIINAWDRAINKLEPLIAAKEKRFEWLLSRYFNGHAYGHIRDFAVEFSERNNRAQSQQILSVTNHSGFTLPEDQFERRVASADLSNYKVVLKGHYAYNPSRINVGSIARLDSWEKGVLSPMYVVFKINEEKVNSDFFLHWLSSHEAKQRIRKSAQGSVRETVSFGDFASIPFPLPLMKQQKEIGSVLNLARREIELLKQLAQSYRKQKRGLMQKLLTGQWRVKVGKDK